MSTMPRPEGSDLRPSEPSDTGAPALRAVAPLLPSSRTREDARGLGAARLRRSAAWTACGVATVAASMGLASALRTSVAGVLVLTGVLGVIAMLIGGVHGLSALATGGASWKVRVGGLLMGVVGASPALLGGVGVLLLPFARGRQVRKGGRLLLPPVTDGDAWASLALEVDVPQHAREGLAAQWRENGRTEHASVAAFGLLTLDLVALGAPPPLVAAAHAAALDEIRHAELCFSLARALDGRRREPGPFPEPRTVRALPGHHELALQRLAVDSLIDGALHEGVSARVVARLARRCEEPVVRAVLEEIASDEGRHAAHGWQVAAWCHAQGGDGVGRALRAALGRVPRAIASGVDPAAADGAWERWGIPGRELEQAEYAAMLANLERRVGELVARSPERAA